MAGFFLANGLAVPTWVELIYLGEPTAAAGGCWTVLSNFATVSEVGNLTATKADRPRVNPHMEKSVDQTNTMRL
jgi:hypothetical protein